MRGASRDRRRYFREWARRNRMRAWERATSGRATCPKRFGKYECGGVLETLVTRDGRTRVVCPRCERCRAGLCLDCAAPVEGQPGRARRCAYHKRVALTHMQRKYRANNRALVNRRAKLAARQHAQRNANYKRLWRAANPEKVAAQKRRYYLRQPETAYAYQREYHKTYRAHFEESRFCLGDCGRTVWGRAKKCAACKAAVAASARRLLRKRAA
jgi:hypothetical protein